MAENIFAEMKRYVRFCDDDGAALRALAPAATPHFRRIADEFYLRLEQHDDARAVFTGPDQVTRLKGTLSDWMALLLAGPWDEAYYEKRARIGRMHVQISLPQRYMFGAMNLIRQALTEIAQLTYAADQEQRHRAVWAIGRIIDLELAIMLETYRESFVDKVQQLERLERTLLERRLAISEARYEEIVEKAEVLIVTADPAGHILLFNRRCEEITGIDRLAAAGRVWLDLFVPDAERAVVRARREQALAGERVLPWEGAVPALAGSMRRVRWHFTTLPGNAEPIVCAIGVDITDEHDLAVRTRRAERLASLGTMAAGLAHEIRNPLNAAHLQLTLLQRRLGRSTGTEQESAKEAATLAASEMKRLASLVEEFLMFARPQPLRSARVDLRATAEVIVALVAPEAAASGVDVSLAPGAPVLAEVDDERIKQVLLNLVRNGAEATGRGGRVQVRVTEAGGTATLEVVDDGPGLPAPDAPIFEPFFTTKESGTGLGLAIVHRIVTDHGGRIGVDSRPGRTVFTLSLPVQAG